APAGTNMTYTRSINAAGSIAGYYTDAEQSHGYVRSPDGTITTFDPEGSLGTQAESIDNNGAITGFYQKQYDQLSGFVRYANGRIITFNPSQSYATYPMSIDARGRITGFYYTAVGDPGQHGFVRVRLK